MVPHRPHDKALTLQQSPRVQFELALLPREPYLQFFRILSCRPVLPLPSSVT